MFIVSIGENLLKNELNSSNTNMSPNEFLEDIFSSVVTFDETATTTPEPEPIPTLNNDDLFAPPVGLEVESGTDIIAKRKGGRIIPKNTGKPKSRIFKVRELSGKKTTIKKGRGVPRKIIKKAPAAMSKKFKAIGKKVNNFNQFMDPILKADVFSVKKFWGKVSSLAYKEFTQLVNMILKETTNRDSRIRATAITALASIAKGVSWEMPPDVMDRALILTSDGSNEVKDAAAEAIREMNEAGVEKTPQFTPTLETKKNKNSMELSELDTDSMLGTGSNSIGSLSIESGSGGVKVMGGETAGISNAPTFEMSKDIPSFNEEKKPAQFKAVSDKPTKFKTVDDKTPKFKPSGKKRPNSK
jgi:hypothetical protein